MVKVALAFVVVFALCKLFSINIKMLRAAVVVAFVIIALVIFRSNYDGYKAASYIQNFNMNAIKQYQLRNDKSLLKLKRMTPTKYGYNVNNWNEMPYFMKECYKINENTVIEIKVLWHLDFYFCFLYFFNDYIIPIYTGS